MEPDTRSEESEEKDQKKNRRPLILGLTAAVLASTVLGAVVLTQLQPKPKAIKKSEGSKKRVERTAPVKKYIAHGRLHPKGATQEREAGKPIENRKTTPRRKDDRKVSDRLVSNAETSPADFLKGADPDLQKDVDVKTTGNRIESVSIAIDPSASDGEIIDKLLKMKDLLDLSDVGDVSQMTLTFSDGRQNLDLNVANLVEDYAIKTIQSSFRYISPRIYKSVEAEVDAEQSLNTRGKAFWERVRVKKVVVHVNASNWDAEPPQDKVNLLNETVQYLKTLYPQVTPFLTLKFDDGRNDLEMKSVL